MTNMTINTKMGARFRLTNIDKVSGEIIEQSDWFSNLILNAARTVMQTGFSTAPTPKVGSSIVDVDPTQTGVQAVISTMAVSSTKELWAGTFTRTSNTEAKMSWGTQYTYVNNGTVAVSVSEIGIDNFNRAVFKDDQGVVKAWSVSPTENLIVEMEFVITFSVPSTVQTIQTTTSDGTVLDSYNMTRTVSNQITTGTPVWWKLLSKPSTNVRLVTDTGFTGITKPSDSNMVFANVASTYTYTDRSIAINIQHRAPAGGQSFKGVLVEFGCLSPALGYVFNNTVRVGSGYTYTTGLTVTW